MTNQVVRCDGTVTTACKAMAGSGTKKPVPALVTVVSGLKGLLVLKELKRAFAKIAV
jgi:uncharacterized membrane protein (UPF0136 family)